MKKKLILAKVFLFKAGVVLYLSFCLLATSPLRGQANSGITADVTSLNFGNQGNESLSSPKNVLLTHQLNGDGIIRAIVITGEDPQQFVILEDFCSGTVLEEEASCSVSLAFRPSIETSQGKSSVQAQLQINFADPPALSIPLSGIILVPNIFSNVSFLDFGEKTAGQLSDPQTVILTNTGEADLLIGTARSTGGDTRDFFSSLDECSFQILATEQTCTLELTMQATELGDRAALFTIESNDPDQPLLSVELFGKGRGSGGCSLNVAKPLNSKLKVQTSHPQKRLDGLFKKLKNVWDLWMN